jgi:hypothetical protein
LRKGNGRGYRHDHAGRDAGDPRAVRAGTRTRRVPTRVPLRHLHVCLPGWFLWSLASSSRCLSPVRSVPTSKCTTETGFWFQIEGAYLEDGKSLNNWDVYTHTQCKSCLIRPDVKVRPETDCCSIPSPLLSVKQADGDS